MITEKAINDNGALVPENLHNLGFGSTCDGTNFYFFETKQEADDFVSANTPPIVDARLAPEYYLIRETVGKELVNEVSNDLLSQYKRGELTFTQIMDIEESLKEVISSLRGGQFYTASYKLSIAQGVPERMKTDLTATINLLIQTHYVV